MHIWFRRSVFFIGGTPAFYRRFGQFVAIYRAGHRKRASDAVDLLFGIGGTLAFHRLLGLSGSNLSGSASALGGCTVGGVLFTADVTSSTLNILTVTQTIWNRIGGTLTFHHLLGLSGSDLLGSASAFGGCTVSGVLFTADLTSSTLNILTVTRMVCKRIGY